MPKDIYLGDNETIIIIVLPDIILKHHAELLTSGEIRSSGKKAIYT